MSKQPVKIIAMGKFTTPIAVHDKIRVLYGNRQEVFVQTYDCEEFGIYGEDSHEDHLTTLDENGKDL